MASARLPSPRGHESVWRAPQRSELRPCMTRRLRRYSGHGRPCFLARQPVRRLGQISVSPLSLSRRIYPSSLAVALSPTAFPTSPARAFGLAVAAVVQP
ncbi:hypothetical protein NL676_036365 [Syzygium grande]|nr:hypothetical protein NL676_036365 [Syzygium grande]